MKIKSIRKGSTASRLGISQGDELVEIDGHPVSDVIDYRFFSTDSSLKLKLKSKGGRTKRVEIKKDPDEDLGLEFHPIRYKACGNNCIFCFVHQLPKGLRRALYFKDEDFRLSFLHGNFITLTNTSDRDIQRIIRQRLSPLYVSAHTTDEGLRKRMLGNPEVPDAMPQIRNLARGRIEMHTQIVLCPGINDGKHLQESITDLSGFFPYVRSVALVPVGLTKFRIGLPQIRSIGKAYSAKIIELVKQWQKVFRRKMGTGFVYAADEFFTKAGLNIPPKRYYDEFYQVENGVGMVRQFLDDFKYKQKLLPARLKNKLSVTIVTGLSAFRLIRQLVREHLSSIPGLTVRLVRVENDFFGHSVTVTGLLSGRDIIAALKKKSNLGNLILLPPNCVNQDGLFLDDLTPADVETESGRKVVVGSYDLVQTLTRLLREFGSED